MWRFGGWNFVRYFWYLGELVHHNKFTYSDEYQKFHKSEWTLYETFGGNVRTIQYDKWTHFRFWWWERLFHTYKIARMGLTSIGRIILSGLIGIVVILAYKFILNLEEFGENIDTLQEYFLIAVGIILGAVVVISALILAVCVFFAITNTWEVFYSSVLFPYYPIGLCYEYAEQAMKMEQYEKALKYYNIILLNVGKSIVVGEYIIERDTVNSLMKNAKKLWEQQKPEKS